MDTRWKPSVTVAAIIERDGRYLLVEEETPEGLRLNNPAGHLDPGETPLQAVVREALEDIRSSIQHGADTARIDAIVAIARAVADGEMELHAGVAASDLRVALLARPGIGVWTADYLTMTVAGDPDILLDTDLVVKNSAAQLGVGAAALAATAPWRSYASMHLWRHALLATPEKTDEGDV